METAGIDPRMTPRRPGGSPRAGLHRKHVYEREAEMFHGSAPAAKQRTEEGTGYPAPFLGTLLLSV
jgi:hypothetical protein